jgi:hypothetical protein
MEQPIHVVVGKVFELAALVLAERDRRGTLQHAAFDHFPVAAIEHVVDNPERVEAVGQSAVSLACARQLQEPAQLIEAVTRRVGDKHASSFQRAANVDALRINTVEQLHVVTGEVMAEHLNVLVLLHAQRGRQDLPDRRRCLDHLVGDVVHSGGFLGDSAAGLHQGLETAALDEPVILQRALDVRIFDYPRVLVETGRLGVRDNNSCHGICRLAVRKRPGRSPAHTVH